MGVVFLTAVFNLLLLIPLRDSILFAVILSTILDLAYVMYKKGILKKKEIKVQNYWPKLAIMEFLVIACSITIPLYTSVDLLKALGIGSFFFIIAEMYYISLSPFIKFSHTTLTLRRVLCFISLTIGWYSLMELNLALSTLAGFLNFLLIESDRKVTLKLYELKLISIEDLRKMSERVLMVPGLVLGMAIGSMIGKGVFSIEIWNDGLPQLFKLYPLIILLFYSIFQPISWIRVYLHERGLEDAKKRERK
ncbi:hypothetical protein [Archaeoglobus sp.]